LCTTGTINSCAEEAQSDIVSDEELCSGKFPEGLYLRCMPLMSIFYTLSVMYLHKDQLRRKAAVPKSLDAILLGKPAIDCNLRVYQPENDGYIVASISLGEFTHS